MIQAFILKYKIYFALAVCVLCIGFGWRLHSIYTEAQENRKLNAEIAKRLQAESFYALKARELESLKEVIRKAGTQRQKEEKHEIRKNPTYTSCLLSSAGVQLSNKAITASNAAAKPN